MADVFICPSRHEPLGNVILEAWYHGVPIISTRSQGPSELITHELDGILVPCRDPDTLSRALELLLCESPAFRRVLAEKGRENLSSRFSRDAITSAYLDLYEVLCNQRA